VSDWPWGGAQDRERLAMRTPERVMLQPAAAGVPCRQGRGWDDASIPPM
jgi:hypothetical protein